MRLRGRKDRHRRCAARVVGRGGASRASRTKQSEEVVEDAVCFGLRLATMEWKGRGTRIGSIHDASGIPSNGMFRAPCSGVWASFSIPLSIALSPYEHGPRECLTLLSYTQKCKTFCLTTYPCMFDRAPNRSKTSRPRDCIPNCITYKYIFSFNFI